MSLSPIENLKGRTVPQYGQGSGLTSDDISRLTEYLSTSNHLSDGQQVELFEQEFCAAMGAPHAIAVSSCTMALELVARLLALRDGDEVIAPSLTFQATVSSFVGTSVRVRFAEVDPQTFCLDAEDVGRKINPRTRAIYTVHYGGLCGNLPALRRLADRHNLILVEDCAHALGAAVHDRSAGTWGDFACWSFHSLKNISTLGQGGMITTRHPEAEGRLRRLRAIEPNADFIPRAGMAQAFNGYEDPRDPCRVTHEKNAYSQTCEKLHGPGLNAQMSEPAAVVGRSQLKRLNSLVVRRNHLARLLDDALISVPGVSVIEVPDGYVHARHLYTFILNDDRIDRDRLVSRLMAHGIDVVLRYFPLHLLPEWRHAGNSIGDLRVTEEIWFEKLMNLPISPQLTDDDVAYMAQCVRSSTAELRCS